MQARQLLIFVALSLLAVVVVLAAVSAYRDRSPHVDTPAAKVETEKPNGQTTIDAPYTHIEKDKEGTKIEAPGVKIEVPNSPAPSNP
jgi:hypothetical protein